MINQNLLLTGDDGYNLTNSLRFRSSASAYLNRTPASASDRQKWTWSGWVKRGALSSGSYMDLFTALTDGNNFTELRFHFNTNDDTLVFTDIAGGTTYAVYSTNVYRDPSSWYHIVCSVDTTQATSTNRVKLYVNGVQVTQNAGGSGYPLQNTNTSVNATVEHRIGGVATYGRYFDGYLAEINFVNAQALTPSSFGETSSTTGVWIPKKYSGTYGTNGFYLPFTDNSALTTSSNAGLGKDFSGNANYWVTNNISITSGSTYDSMTDVPTLTSATAANYCVWNPLKKTSGVTVSNANLTLTVGASINEGIQGTIGASSGKWYAEVTGGPDAPGVVLVTDAADYPGATANSYGYHANATKYNNGSSSSYGATFTSTDVIGIALDMDAGTVTFYKNNVSQGTAFTGLVGTFTFCGRPYGATSDWNFGQRPFTYTPPSGFVSLNTFNLPTPTIGATASTQANDYFNVVTYSGTSATQTVSGVNFQPDFVWIKNRNNGLGFNHVLQDAVRGFTTGKKLASNLTTQEGGTNLTDDLGYVSSANSDGFVLSKSGTGSYDWYQTNATGDTYVAWNWKANGSGSSNTQGTITSTVSANTSAGFSIVTWTGNGTSGATVGHGLGVAPSMYIVKSRSAANNWCVYHVSLGNQYATLLNSTAGSYSNSNYWNNTSPTSTVFSLGNGGDTNQSSATFVAYCFAQVAGYSAFGSYTGNGSSDGTFVYTGFRPRWVMVKNTVDPNNWILFDTARNTYNIVDLQLYPNTSDAEVSGGSSNGIDFLSNGFKVRSSNNWGNRNGDTIIYACFAENPFKYANAR